MCWRTVRRSVQCQYAAKSGLFWISTVFLLILSFDSIYCAEQNNDSNTIVLPSEAAALLKNATSDNLAFDESIPNDSYTTDCADQHYKDVLSCSVHIVDCKTDKEKLVPKIVDSLPAPGEAHDIRIEPFAKALSRRPTNALLTVDISWQTPPNNSTRLLSAFLLEIKSEDRKQQVCFLFNVSKSNWTPEAISSSPRLHFSTDSVFKFNNDYDVTVYTLPQSTSRTRSVHKKFSAPHNPFTVNHSPTSGFISPNCSQYSNPYASRWSAGFRKIYLHSLARQIQLEFVGAPPQYCFEQYEVRLLDETGLELVHSGIVKIEEMRRETIKNSTVFFGEFNFTNLEMEKGYIPSVIPVERAHDGRCLCPVYGTDPYDNKVVCSCVAADYKPVRLSRVIVENNPNCPNCVNATVPPLVPKPQQPESGHWTVLLVLNLIFLAIILAGLILVLITYRRYKKTGKISRIRLVHDPKQNHYSDGDNGKLLANGTVEKVNLENGGVAMSKNPLLLISPGANLNILIVYAHDSKEHEAAVTALAELLRDVFHMQVGLDCWDGDKIERNMVDYLSSSVVNADKIVVVNSVGAIHRYHCKIAGGDYVVERNSAGTFDHLFLAQIDMVLQHSCIVSTRFTNSTNDDVLPMLQGCLQYVIPTNLVPLVSALVGRNLKQDPRFTGFTPQMDRLNKAVQVMEGMSQREPGWFLKTHHRRPIPASRSMETALESSFNLAAHAEELLPVHGDSAVTMVSSAASTIEQTHEEEEEPLVPTRPQMRQQSISLQMSQIPQTSVEIAGGSSHEIEEELGSLSETESEGRLKQEIMVEARIGADNTAYYMASQPVDSGMFETVDESLSSGQSQTQGNNCDQNEVSSQTSGEMERPRIILEDEEVTNTSEDLRTPEYASQTEVGRTPACEDVTKRIPQSRDAADDKSDKFDSGMISDAEMRLVTASS
ncbi:SEFIR domain-containing protein [Ditylenchus destructor]|nr:SEFIR domain-containing protein [Ditylenchus destructor]